MAIPRAAWWPSGPGSVRSRSPYEAFPACSRSPGSQPFRDVPTAREDVLAGRSGAKRPGPSLKRPARPCTLGGVSATATPNERLRTAMLRTGTTPEDLAPAAGPTSRPSSGGCRWAESPTVATGGRQPTASASRRRGCGPARPHNAATTPPGLNWCASIPTVRASPARRGSPSWAAPAKTSPSWSCPAPSSPRHSPGSGSCSPLPPSRGVRVRLCFGDPSANAVATRDREEGLGGTLGHKIRSSLTYYRDIAAAGDCEIRLHGCTLYASLFRYDDDILVNPHAWASPRRPTPPCTCASSMAARSPLTTWTASNEYGTRPSRGTERGPDGLRPH